MKRCFFATFPPPTHLSQIYIFCHQKAVTLASQGFSLKQAFFSCIIHIVNPRKSWQVLFLITVVAFLKTRWKSRGPVLFSCTYWVTSVTAEWKEAESETPRERERVSVCAQKGKDQRWQFWKWFCLVLFVLKCYFINNS